MKVLSINLINFRNFLEKKFQFKDGINLISAPNGKGKTNVLEAIRIMCFGKPIFGSRESDVINIEVFESNLPFTKILFDWENDEPHNSIYTLSPTMKPLKSLVLDEKRTPQKIFIGRFSCVWFSPETINVITSSPRVRRELLDAYFCQISSEYSIALNEYQKAVEGRNRLLKVPDRNSILRFLPKYDEVLAIKGAELMTVKSKIVEELTKNVEINSKKQNRYNISFRYEPNIEISNIFDENIHEKILIKLRENRERDLASKRTSVGPHRDDWTLTLVDNSDEDNLLFDLRNYGSRGQKRMGLLILTLTFVDMLEQVKGSKPVMLLDDVVSELDDENVELILHMLNSPGQQSIITSTHDKIDALKKVNLIRL